MSKIPYKGVVGCVTVPDSFIIVRQGGQCFVTGNCQLEVVIAAHYSQDKNLLRIINEGVSKHDITNEGLGLNDRHLAKTINFAAQYQCSPKKIAKLINGTEEQGKVIWNKYWETYAGERRIVEECIAKVKANQPIINLFGRRRRFPNVKELDHWEREACYRQSYSALIQGSGGDITSEALYLVNDSLRTKGIGKALFTIHDEVMITARIEACEEAKYIIKSIMEAVGKKYLSVELKAQVSEPMERWEK